jgi:pre-60S factor REI1
MTCKSRVFTTQSAYQAHFKSKKHLKKLAKQKHKLGVSVASKAGTDANSMEAGSNAEDSKVAAAAALEQKQLTGEEDVGEAKQKTVCVPKAIPLGGCLFCKKTFGKPYKLAESNEAVNLEALKACLAHMHKAHDFYLPFAEFLCDAEGLLAYLGEKVGLGFMCIGCNHKFPSIWAVRQHMDAKRHRIMALETEDDQDEYLDFYDFDDDNNDIVPSSESEKHNMLIKDSNDESKQMVKQDSKTAATTTFSNKKKRDMTALSTVLYEKTTAIPRGERKVVDINAVGELVMSDGSIIGHRSLRNYYKQNLRPVRESESMVKGLMHSYRAITCGKFGNKSTHNQVTKAQTRFRNKQRMRIAYKSIKINLRWARDQNPQYTQNKLLK